MVLPRHYLLKKRKNHNCTKNGFDIINLDAYTDSGTHWVAIHVKNDLIPYFDFCALNCTQEVVDLSDKLGVNYVYNSSQRQDLLSVLCGYHSIYGINEVHKYRSYFETVRLFDQRNTIFNKKFIMDYFM